MFGVTCYQSLSDDSPSRRQGRVVEWFRNVGNMRLVTSVGQVLYIINAATRRNRNQLPKFQFPSIIQDHNFT